MVKVALFFSRPQRAETHPSLQSPFSQGWEAHWSHTLRPIALLSHFAGEEGMRNMPPSGSFSMLRKSGHTAERCKTSSVNIKVSLDCQYIILFLHTCRTRQCTTDGWTTAFSGNHTSFYSTSQLHTENKQPTNWKGGKIKPKHLNFRCSFWFSIKKGSVQDFLSTVDLPQLHCRSCFFC